jgi:prophage regulatory protein
MGFFEPFKKAFMQEKQGQPAPSATTPDATLPRLPTEATLWRLPIVLEKFPVSRANWLQGVKDGRYPAPVRLSARRVAWRASDINFLIASL